MASPFWPRNAALLLVAAGNLALAVRVLATWPGAEVQGALLVALRGAAVLYAAVSLVVFLVVALIFALYELTSEARTCWRRSRAWHTIAPGMTRDAAIALLGAPFQASSSVLEGVAEQLPYQLHPLGALDEAHVYVKPDGTVHSSRPAGELLERVRAEWIPQGHGGAVFRDHVRAAVLLVAIAGLLALAVAALVPVGAGSARSWMLYAPLVAALMGALYEACRAPGGWRFDGCILVPLYLVVVAGWLARLVPVVSSS